MLEIKNLCCPITNQIYADPVLATDEYTYERDAIEKWLRTSLKSPLTGKQLTDTTLITNRQFKIVINDYLSKNKHHFESDDVYLSERLLNDIKFDILSNKIDSIKFKLSTYLDYRYFIKDLNFDNRSEYTSFHLACEHGSVEILLEIYQYLIENNYLTKLVSKPDDWNPIYLIKFVQNLKLDQLMNEKYTKLVKLAHECLYDLSQRNRLLSNKMRFIQSCFRSDFNYEHKFIATGDQEGNILIWNIETGCLVRTKKYPFDTCLLNLQCLTNGEIITFQNTIIKSWNPGLDEPIKSLYGHLDDVESIKLINNKVLATGSSDGTIKIWDLEQKIVIKSFNAHDDSIFDLEAMSKDILISTCNDSSIKIWNLNTAKCLRTLEEHSGSVKLIRKLNENQFLSFSFKMIVKLWNVETGECTKRLNLNYFLQDLNECWIDDVLVLKNLQIAFSFRNSRGKIFIYDLDDCSLVRTLEGHTEDICQLKLLPNGNLISCSCDRFIKIWDLDKGLCLSSFTDGKKTPILRSMVLIPNLKFHYD